MTITRDHSESKLTLFMGLLFISLILISIYGLIQVYPPKNMAGLSFVCVLVFMIILSIPSSICAFFYYFYSINRKTEMIFNLKKNELIYRSVSPKLKEKMKFSLSKVENIYYYRRTGGYGMSYYYLKLNLKERKDFKVLNRVSKEKLMKAGEIISKFIHKPLIDRGEKYGNMVFGCGLILLLFIFLIMMLISLL